MIQKGIAAIQHASQKTILNTLGLTRVKRERLHQRPLAIVKEDTNQSIRCNDGSFMQEALSTSPEAAKMYKTTPIDLNLRSGQNMNHLWYIF